MKLRHDMLTHGVNVVTARQEDRLAGLAVAWATQTATDRILICVGSQSATRGLILGSGAFGLSVLKREQLQIARTFGRKSSRDVDKFAGLGHHAAETGSPLLDDCIAAFDCRVESVHDQDGGSKLIVGRIVHAELNQKEAEPLLYKEEDYG
jgi:flavin reductase (DIM6/NTAB) family NADH-FMN oxidoreductase RutF